MIEQVIGIIIKINGPIIDAKGMRSASMLEVVGVGEEHLISEVIRLNGDIATLQVYEPTYGLKPGDPVYCSGMPLSVSLGPGRCGKGQTAFTGDGGSNLRIDEIIVSGEK